MLFCSARSQRFKFGHSRFICMVSESKRKGKTFLFLCLYVSSDIFWASDLQRQLSDLLLVLHNLYCLSDLNLQIFYHWASYLIE